MLTYFILLLPSFTCIFWAITLFTLKKVNNRSQKLWGLLAFIMGISTFIWSIFFSGVNDYNLFYKLELIEALSTLLLLPLLYLSFRTLTDETPLKRKEYLGFLPPILIGGGMLLLYIMMGDQNATAYIQEITENGGHIITFTDPIYRIHNFISVYLYMIIVFGEILFILIFSTIRLIRYHYRLNDFFSNKEGKSIENGNILLFLLYFILIFSLACYKGRFHYHNSPIFAGVSSIIWTIIAYVLGYNVYHLRYTADNFAQDLLQSDKEAILEGYGIAGEIKTNEDEPDNIKSLRIRILPKLRKIIDEENIFLKNDLRLDEIARLTHTNRTYISRLIKDEYNCSFSDLINHKRIEYAKELIRSNPQLTQEQIAQMSGFIHSSNFSRTFKQHAGTTFREFTKKI